MFHQELNHPTLRATAEAPVTVAFWINDEGTEVLIVVEWAKGFIPNACLLQSRFVLRAVASEAVLNDLLDPGCIENLIDDFFSYFCHTFMIALL